MAFLSRLRRPAGGGGGNTDAPVPPQPLPPGRSVVVPGRGEFFVRDSGQPIDPAGAGAGRTVLLIHGWMFPSDLNWLSSYAPLQRAGYRVVAMDLRGHGRGLRSAAPFRLADCAADAAGVLAALDAGPAIAIGYSMGGPVAQLLAHNHAEAASAMVLCATALDWK